VINAENIEAFIAYPLYSSEEINWTISHPPAVEIGLLLRATSFRIANISWGVVFEKPDLSEGYQATHNRQNENGS
jgi:hypothetical protein